VHNLRPFLCCPVLRRANDLDMVLSLPALTGHCWPRVCARSQEWRLASTPYGRPFSWAVTATVIARAVLCAADSLGVCGCLCSVI